MDTMDLKGIAWVGNIYQKFEAMCLEVEETMCQETAKYVENQVQTVGVSMKRFCSDVMQDLLPPSSKDLSKVASADLLLNPYLEYGIYKKPISSIKEDAIDTVSVKNISEKNSNPSNDVWVDWSEASFDWEKSDHEEANCDQMAIQPSNEAVECEPRGEICNIIRIEDMSENGGLVSGSQASSGDSDTDLKEENVYESESEFEATCVLVEGDDYHPVNQKEDIKQSYKKKIRGVFFPKKKSGRKQEYKQLVARCENMNTEPGNVKGELLDSEWELL